MNKLKKSTKKVSAVLLAGALLVPGGIFAEGQVKNDYSTHWAKATIQKWVDEGLIKGVAGKGVLPNTSVKRAEFVRMANMRYAYSIPAEANKFTDVKAKDWFYRDILIAQKENYIAGITATMFGPNQTVTREQAATIVARIAKVENDVAGVSVFKDANKIAEYAKGSIGGAVKKGLLSGYEDNTFRPKNPLTRAEAIVILDKAYQTGKPDLITPDPEDKKLEDKKPEDKKPGTEVSSERPYYGGGGGGSYYPSYPSIPSVPPTVDDILQSALNNLPSDTQVKISIGDKLPDLDVNKSMFENVNKYVENSSLDGRLNDAGSKVQDNMARLEKLYFWTGSSYEKYVTNARFDEKVKNPLANMGFVDLANKLKDKYDNRPIKNGDAKEVVQELLKIATPSSSGESVALDESAIVAATQALEEPYYKQGTEYKPVEYTIELQVDNGEKMTISRGHSAQERETFVRTLLGFYNEMTKPVKESLGRERSISVKVTGTIGTDTRTRTYSKTITPLVQLKVNIPLNLDQPAYMLGVPGVETSQDVETLKSLKSKMISELGLSETKLSKGTAMVDFAELKKKKDVFSPEELTLLKKMFENR